MLAVAELRTIAQLDEVGDLWADLQSEMRGVSAGLSFDRFCNVVHPTGCDPSALTDCDPWALQPRVFVASVAGRTIGLLPLVVKSVKTGLGKLRVLTQPVDPVFGVWGCVPLGKSSAATLLAVFKHLRDSRRDWDMIDLTVESERIRRRVINAMRVTGMACHQTVLPNHPAIDVATRLIHYAALKPRAQLLRFGRWLANRDDTAEEPALPRFDTRHAPAPRPKLRIVG